MATVRRTSMSILDAVVQVAVLPVFDAREDLSRRRAVALQPIGDDDPWHVPAALEELAEERLGRVRVPPALHETIQDVAVLIHRPPQLATFAVHGENALSQATRVAWLRAFSP